MTLKGTFLVLVAVLAFLHQFAVRVKAYIRLCHIPGPRTAPWTQLWLAKHAASGRLNMKLAEVCSAYGPLTRIAPDWVVCSDSKEIRRIWNIRSGYRRSTWYKAIRLNPHEDNVLNALDNKAHHAIRSQIQPGYVGKNIHEEQHVDQQIERLISLIDSKYVSTREATKPCNLVRTMQFLTQDVITAVGFGQAAGYLEVDNDQFGILKTSEDLGLPVHVMTVLPSLQRLSSLPIMDPFLPRPHDGTGVGRFLGFVKDQVDQRYDGDKIHRNDMLQTFVDSKLTRSQVEGEALVTLFGGTDTTSTALRTTVFQICSNAKVCRLLQVEIDEAVQTASRPIISDSQAKSMPYLQAVIKESMRIWPPSMGAFGKVSDNDDVICGYKIPAGTVVAWSAMSIFRDQSVFGADADVFDPSRWIDAQNDQSPEGKEKLREMESVYGLVFATGTRWECLGKKMAYIEMGKVLFEVCHLRASTKRPIPSPFPLETKISLHFKSRTPGF